MIWESHIRDIDIVCQQQKTAHFTNPVAKLRVTYYEEHASYPFPRNNLGPNFT